MQLYEWSCGSASVSNALSVFDVHVDERRVIPVAGTTPPSKCAHCMYLKRLISARDCLQSYWKCPCDLCKKIRRVWRKDCDAGTSEAGMIEALRRFGGPKGVTATEYQTESTSNAWQWLHGSLIHGRVAIICVDSWRHWSLAFGTAGDRVAVFDPYPSKRNIKSNGIQVLSKVDLMRRWKNTRQWVGKQKALYAISVGK